MALRPRDHVNILNNPDRENVHARANAKALLAKQPALRRPALDEVSNKINGQKAVLKKAETLKDIRPQKNVKPLKDANTTKKCDDVVAAYSSKQLDIIDPDAESKNEPQMVTEYINDIFGYLRELETKYPIRENFLEGHQSTPRMRAVLVNWLVQVHLNFKLCLETLHMCVSIIDRYLQDNKDVGRDTLQLVGASALLVACKYEEMYLPELSDFVYVCDDTFSKKQILCMEIQILNGLECNLGRPVSVHFLRRYSKIAQVKSEQHTLAKYLLELALLEYNLCHIKPSIVAAAACCLSIAILAEYSCPSKAWTPTLAHYTTYKYSDFKPVVTSLAHVLIKTETSKHQAVRNKYSAANFHKISLNVKLKGRLVKKLTSETPVLKQ